MRNLLVIGVLNDRFIVQVDERVKSADDLISLLPSPYSDENLEVYVAEDDIGSASTVHLLPVLAGGAKKRKKKTYSTPKKNKHKHKKTPLAVLKLYKVVNGEISRQRRECSNAACGAGVFMAKHFDREYCGKCCLTYMISTGEKISKKDAAEK